MAKLISTTTEIDSPALSAARATFVRKAAVTVPTLKLEPEKPVFIRFNAPFKIEEPSEAQIASAKGKGEVANAVIVAQVTDLESGEIRMLVARAVFHSDIIKAYPDNGYVGKAFEITMHKVEGKRYRLFDIYEIDA